MSSALLRSGLEGIGAIGVIRLEEPCSCAVSISVMVDVMTAAGVVANAGSKTGMREGTLSSKSLYPSSGDGVQNYCFANMHFLHKLIK
jgi:hypothetical protein